VASGPDQPPAGPPRLADSLARHRWVAAAGMTATIAAVAGGGLALALHDNSSGPPKECGLVPCAAALPASVQSSGDESASAPAAVAPTAARRSAPPPGPAPSPTSPTSPAASPAAPGAAPPEAAPPADRPASAERVPGPETRASCTTVIAFTARVGAGAPVRCTFTVVAVGQHRSRDGSGHPGPWAAGQDSDRAGGQPGSGRSSHDGWLGSWLNDWLSRDWSGSGWHDGGWSGGGWSGGGWSGQHGGWPGSR
jgi:hypothetical protein